MSYDPKAIEDLLQDAEPVVWFYARNVRFPNKCVDQDDIAQYLRVEAWKLAQSFDKERKQWKGHLHAMLKFRLIDAMRHYGCLDRSGKVKRRTKKYVTFTELSHEQDDNLVFDPRDTSRSEVAELEYQELETKACRKGSITVRALFLRFRGYTMAEIGMALGVSESRVSQMLAPTSGQYIIAMDRVRFLAGES